MLLKGQTAPDFALNDTTGKAIQLSEYRGNKIVILAFLRGFM